MFNLFKKKEQSEILSIPVDGELIPLSKVADPVFSQKMMGEGFGVNPISSEIYSPVNGTITTIFKTKHAIGIETASGLEILVHIGIDTVSLEGAPFELFVAEGEKVTPETKLAAVDFEQIEAAEKETTVLVLITNSDDKVAEFVAEASGKRDHQQKAAKAVIKQ